MVCVHGSAINCSNTLPPMHWQDLIITAAGATSAVMLLPSHATPEDVQHPDFSARCLHRAHVSERRLQQDGDSSMQGECRGMRGTCLRSNTQALACRPACHPDSQPWPTPSRHAASCCPCIWRPAPQCSPYRATAALRESPAFLLNWRLRIHVVGLQGFGSPRLMRS